MLVTGTFGKCIDFFGIEQIVAVCVLRTDEASRLTPCHHSLRQQRPPMTGRAYD